MNDDLTHASFFSGVGGLDLGLERAGWRTVSFSEIDPYASAVLAERWPGVPNLGDIVGLQDGEYGGGRRLLPEGGSDIHAGLSSRSGHHAWQSATLWSGGFPCQDLSVAGKRRGMGTAEDRTRSGLAFAFLDLVERYRPPAILFENVPGLLSSNAGRDFGALLGRLADLGYWWAYRILDAQHFGVPQRRRRVFVVALHAGAGFGSDSAAAVLSVGTRCGGHFATGDEAGEGAARGAQPSVDEAGFYNATARFGEFTEGTVAGNLSARDYKSANHLVGPPPDPSRNGKADGLAGGLDDRVHPSLRAGGHGSPGIGRDGDEGRLVLSPTLRVGPARPQDGGPGDAGHLVYRKATRAHHDDDWERWEADQLADTIDANGHTARTATAILGSTEADDPLLPLGLDSHRYRCCGNGVVSNVAEWIGIRLREAMA